MPADSTRLRARRSFPRLATIRTVASTHWHGGASAPRRCLAFTRSSGFTKPALRCRISLSAGFGTFSASAADHLGVEIRDFDLERLGFSLSVLDEPNKRQTSEGYLRMTLAEMNTFVKALRAAHETRRFDVRTNGDGEGRRARRGCRRDLSRAFRIGCPAPQPPTLEAEEGCRGQRWLPRTGSGTRRTGGARDGEGGRPASSHGASCAEPIAVQLSRTPVLKKEKAERQMDAGRRQTWLSARRLGPAVLHSLAAAPTRCPSGTGEEFQWPLTHHAHELDRPRRQER